jgi:hypothetical protein
MLDEDLDARRPLRALPSYGVIQARYATWDEALISAGLSASNGRHNKNFPSYVRRSKRFTDDAILDAIRLARAQIKGRMTLKAYEVWRQETMDAADAAGAYCHLPAEYAISARFGTWVGAVSLALSTGGAAVSTSTVTPAPAPSPPLPQPVPATRPQLGVVDDKQRSRDGDGNAKAAA